MDKVCRIDAQCCLKYQVGSIPSAARKGAKITVDTAVRCVHLSSPRGMICAVYSNAVASASTSECVYTAVCEDCGGTLSLIHLTHCAPCTNLLPSTTPCHVPTNDGASTGYCCVLPTNSPAHLLQASSTYQAAARSSKPRPQIGNAPTRSPTQHTRTEPTTSSSKAQAKHAGLKLL